MVDSNQPIEYYALFRVEKRMAEHFIPIVIDEHGHRHVSNLGIHQSFILSCVLFMIQS